MVLAIKKSLRWCDGISRSHSMILLRLANVTQDYPASLVLGLVVSKDCFGLLQANLAVQVPCPQALRMAHTSWMGTRLLPLMLWEPCRASEKLPSTQLGTVHGVTVQKRSCHHHPQVFEGLSSQGTRLCWRLKACQKSQKRRVMALPT